MKKLPRILFLLEDLCYGGTQRQNLELALRLDRKRFAPMLLTLTGPTDMDGRVVGLPLAHLGTTRKVPPFFFATLGKWLAFNKPDIIIPCTALPNIWGRIWGKLLRVPLIIGTCRGGGAPKRQHEKFLWRFASHIICNSHASVNAMQSAGVPADHLTFIANGLDTAHFQPPAAGTGRNKDLILCVARLAGDKNHRLLLAAFEKVWLERPETRLRLVGDGPLRQELEVFRDRQMSPGAAAAVEFAGASADPLQHYQEACIFALASEREGQPNVILEAMSCGLPICATRVGGIPDLVRHEETGLLSESCDVEALAENLLFLLRNRPLAEKFGISGRMFAENNHSFQKMVESHETLFETQLAKRAGVYH